MSQGKCNFCRTFCVGDYRFSTSICEFDLELSLSLESVLPGVGVGPGVGKHRVGVDLVPVLDLELTWSWEPGVGRVLESEVGVGAWFCVVLKPPELALSWLGVEELS